MHKDATLLVTGSAGVLGTALKRIIKDKGLTNCFFPTRNELNLLDAKMTLDYIGRLKPDIVIHLASLVYGLGGNLKNQFFAASQNSLINNNLFEALVHAPPRKIFFSGTVASYPFPYTNLPLKEDFFFNGLPHYGEFGYAMAKRHAYTYLEILRKEKDVSFTYGIFTNLFGENDKFDIGNGHVIPSLIAKAYNAKKLGQRFDVWGDGLASRDFLYSFDAASAIMFLLEKDFEGLINISSNKKQTIKEVAELLAKEVGIDEINYLTAKPVGISERVVCNQRLLNSGFEISHNFESALSKTFKWYSKKEETVK